jgi:hypothetical protein
MNDSLEKLKEFAGPLSASALPNGTDWARLEEEIGLVIPADFKRLSSVFGCGRFGADLYLWSPCAASPKLRLSRARLEEFSAEMSEFAEPKLFPHPAGFVCVLSTTQRIHFGYRRNAHILSPSIVQLDFSLEETEEIHLPVTDFLIKAYEGDVGDLRDLIWGSEDDFFTPLSD